MPNDAPRGLTIDRMLCPEGTVPEDLYTWETSRVEIKDKDGAVVWSQDDVEFPEHFSPLARQVVASKFFYGPLEKSGVDPAAGGREHSMRQLARRVAETLARWGREGGYFASEADADAFRDELLAASYGQYAAFNSPVWFNVGIGHKYGIRGGAENWRWDEAAGRAVPCEDSYAYPQGSACFIMQIDDSMTSIMANATAEAMLFKHGSGVGSSLSHLRSRRERLSGGGRPSGPLSFFRVFDSVAGVVTSGGRTRRAARLNNLRADHPDILEFIRSKKREEDKARALIRQGYSPDFNGEAYQSVAFQNTNISIWATDAFLDAARGRRDWQTIAVTTGTPFNAAGERMPSYNAGELLDEAAACAWDCGDPGMQYADVIEAWHTVPNFGPIEATNPCQPAFATVLTPDGIRTIGDIEAGSTIWSGSEWTRVARKVRTGRKPVFRVQTTAGAFVGTEDHEVISAGSRVRAGDADSIDRCVGPRVEAPGEIDPSDVMDGWVFGDGSVHKASRDLVYLNVGVGDGCVHDELPRLIGAYRPGINKYAWEVETSIDPAELPRTYARQVPDRFYFGSESEKRGFLRGLYAANGSVCGGRVTLKASSFDVIRRVQDMLSSLGIPSYYTTNRPTRIRFSNGEYEYRQSYDLNITHGRDEFARLIGFIHEDKAARLAEAMTKTQRAWSKTTYDVESVEELGEHEVYDVEVEASGHTYWTGGLKVANCSEYVHVNSSACNLCAVNWMKFLRDDGTFDVGRFRHVCRIHFIAQEILVDRASYPTREVAENSHRLRPIGQGPCGVGAVLMGLGLPYDSDAGRALAASIQAIAHGECYRASAEIAGALGPFEAFEANREPMLRVVRKHLDAAAAIAVPDGAPGIVEGLRREAVAGLEAALDDGRAYGYRNSQATVAMPCGTVAFMLDSSDFTGIEPAIALVAYKNLAGGGQLKLVNGMVGRALAALGYSDEPAWRGRGSEVADILAYVDEHGTVEGCPDVRPGHVAVFDCAYPARPGGRTIPWTGHLKMVAALQPFLSGSASKTINMPRDATPGDIRDAYLLARDLGLKCISIYRDGSKESQPLSTTKESKDDGESIREGVGEGDVRPAARPARGPGGVPGDGVDRPADGRDGGGDGPGRARADGGRGAPREVEPVRAVGAQGVPRGGGGGGSAVPARRKLPKTRRSLTHHFEVAGHGFYLTAGLYDDGSPGELFITTGKEGSTIAGLMDTVGVLVSHYLQYGLPLAPLVDKFRDTSFPPSGFTDDPDMRMTSSVVDYIFRWLDREFGVKTTTPEATPPTIEAGTVGVVTAGNGPPCERCGNLMVRTGPCYRCVRCGESLGSCG